MDVSCMINLRTRAMHKCGCINIISLNFPRRYNNSLPLHKIQYFSIVNNVRKSGANIYRFPYVEMENSFPPYDAVVISFEADIQCL